MTFDTPRLDNAYRKFGNVMYVDGWFGAECFRPAPVRNADCKGRVVSVTRNTSKPLWYRPVVQITYRPAERLRMEQRLDFALIYCNKPVTNIEVATAYELELLARKKPHKDWRVELIDAFESLTYQRQGRNKWLLIEIGKGYA